MVSSNTKKHCSTLYLLRKPASESAFHAAGAVAGNDVGLGRLINALIQVSKIFNSLGFIGGK